MRRRALLASIGGGALASFAGCVGTGEDSEMTLSVINYVEDSVEVSISVTDDGDSVFEETDSHPANNGDIPVEDYGVIETGNVGDGYHVSATREDVPFTDESTVILSCTPQHNVFISIGVDENQLKVISDEC